MQGRRRSWESHASADSARTSAAHSVRELHSLRETTHLTVASFLVAIARAMAP